MNDVMIDVRNEAIVQSANVLLLAHKAVLVGLGATMLGVDNVQAFARRAVERGESAEAESQKLASDVQQQALARVRTADQTRIALTENAVATMLESANGALKILGIPEMKVVFRSAQVQESSENRDE